MIRATLVCIFLSSAVGWRFPGIGILSTTPSAMHYNFACDNSLLNMFVQMYQGEKDNRAQVAHNDANGYERCGLKGGHELLHMIGQPISVRGAPADCKHVIETWSKIRDDGKLIPIRQRLSVFREVLDDVQFGHCIQQEHYKLRAPIIDMMKGVGSRLSSSIAFTQQDDLSDGLQIDSDADLFWCLSSGDQSSSAAFNGHLRKGHYDMKDSKMVRFVNTKLAADTWSVSDRLVDASSGRLINGNSKGIPYEMVDHSDTLSHVDCCDSSQVAYSIGAMVNRSPML